MDDTAQRFTATVGMIIVHTAKVRAAGAALPLGTDVVVAAMRPSSPGEDHLGRTRIARTLGLPTPAAPPKTVGANAAAPTSSELATARAATRILAATGPLDMATLLGALTRARRWKQPGNLPAETLAAALTTIGSTQTTDGHWQAPARSPVPDRYQLIAAAGAGRDLAEMPSTPTNP